MERNSTRSGSWCTPKTPHRACYPLLRRNLGDLYTESGQTLQCSFSSVSTPPIARIDVFFKALFAIYKIFTPSHRSELKISAEKSHIVFVFLQKILESFQKFGQILLNFDEISPEFHVNFELLKGRGRVEVFRTFFSFFQADALHCAAF